MVDELDRAEAAHAKVGAALDLLRVTLTGEASIDWDAELADLSEDD